MDVFFYTNQSCTPFFAIWSLKTESDFIIRSVETGLGRWWLVVGVISVESYPFFCLSQTWTVTVRIEELVISDCTVPPDSNESKLGSSNQEASPSAGKNTRTVLVLSHMWKCVHIATSSSEDISDLSGGHLFWQMSSQWAS